MFRKLRKIFSLFIILSIFLLAACSSKDSTSSTNAIKASISLNGKDHNYLEDEEFLEMLREFVRSNHPSIEERHFVIGNLNDDNIPEIVVFLERDSNDQKDKGSLIVYEYTGDNYSVADSIPMNYDNTNYQMAIGNIGMGKNGLYINNQVGAHSGMTYGFILEDGKLKSILNDKKINLLSAYTNNEIKDIDGDGILEFSIYTIDPESENTDIASSDKLLLWYKWDGKDSAELIDVENYSEETGIAVNRGLRSAAALDNNVDMENFFQYIKDNISNLSKDESTNLIKSYNEYILTNKTDFIEKLDKLFKKYEISVNPKAILDFNNKDFINNNEFFIDKEDLKENLLTLNSLGYRIYSRDKNIDLDVDYNQILEIADDNIKQEYKEYINIKSLNSSIMQNTEEINMEDLAKNLAKIEHFKSIYPYSESIDDVNKLYDDSLKLFLCGDNDSADFKTIIENKEISKEFRYAIEKYESNHFTNILKEVLRLMENHNYVMDENIKSEIDNIIDNYEYDTVTK